MHKLMILGSMDEFVDLVEMAKDKGITTLVCDGYEDGPAKPLRINPIRLMFETPMQLPMYARASMSTV